jgi:hypothetical protein
VRAVIRSAYREQRRQVSPIAKPLLHEAVDPLEQPLFPEPIQPQDAVEANPERASRRTWTSAISGASDSSGRTS